MLIGSLSQGMITLMLATGDIRKYQLVVGGVVLLDFPLSYIALKLGFTPTSVFVISVFIALVCLFLRLKMLKDMVDFPVKEFVKTVLLRVGGVFLLSLCLPLFITYFMPESILRFFLNLFVCILTSVIIVWVIGCTTTERKMLLVKAKQLLRLK